MTKNVLLEKMYKPKNIKYICYQALLDTRVGWIAAGDVSVGPVGAEVANTLDRWTISD